MDAPLAALDRFPEGALQQVMADHFNIRTVEDMNRAIMFGLRNVPRDVDLVVGIPRSGLLAANLISLYLNLPLTDLKGLSERRLLATGKRFVPNNDGSVFETARKILVVDDCISMGTELDKARRSVQEAGFSEKSIFFCVYGFPERPHKADIVLEVIPRPMAFQWSCMHSDILSECCVDIDGVLCADAEPNEDDDGANYLSFLENATPLFIPTTEIGWLVTCRLEKYREQTERWMAKHGIRYRHLVMMDYPDKETRERERQHAVYKAETYINSGARLFIESDAGLGRAIEEKSGLPVLCLDTGALRGRRASDIIDVYRNRLAWYRRRLRRAPRKIRTLASNLLAPRAKKTS